jgi:hypothetical protein
MLRKFMRYLKSIRSMQRVNMALARGGATSALRTLDLTNPGTWEFCGFSQNGEDGIIDVLISQLTDSNRYFIEIGASDGLENNTTWLAMARRFSGLWIEGDRDASQWCEYIFGSMNYGVECVCEFIKRESIEHLKKKILHSNPDVFSLDIDGNDYFIVESVLASGMRPKIFVAEYNAVYGPDESVSIPYDETFCAKSSHPDNLYYGCSVKALRKLFESYGYRFVTVDFNGVNAFFVDPDSFDPGFLGSVKGIDYRENFSNACENKVPWHEQFELIRHRRFVYLGAEQLGLAKLDDSKSHNKQVR